MDLGNSLQSDVDAIRATAAIPIILDVVCRLTDMGFAAVARVTDQHWIACEVLDRIDFGLRSGGELNVETTICREIRKHRAPVVINDAAADVCYSNHPTPALYNFRSYISVPIILPDGSFFGTLCAIDPNPRTLDVPDITGTFKLFAELIAFHVDANLRLASSATALIQERAFAELREQFIAVLGHDLRNPLASVAAGLRLILRQPERAASLAPAIEGSIARMSGLIDNVLDFARGRLGEGMSLTLEDDAPVSATVSQIVEELRSTRPGRLIEVAFDLREPVRCDPARLSQLLSNLLGNALTHGAAELPVRVHASSGSGVFELTVTNGGTPIPAATMPHLFHPFFRGTVRPSQEGLGLGLFIAAEIARAHNGRIDVSSNDEQTRFALRLPSGQTVRPLEADPAAG